MSARKLPLVLLVLSTRADAAPRTTAGDFLYDATNSGNAFSSGFGWAMAAAGDVNGDGYGDFAVGAPTYGQDHTDGRVFVYEQTWDGPVAHWALEGGGRLGYAVASAGDVDGDGYADLLVGAPGGLAAYVYLGSWDGPEATPAWTGHGGGGFGESVAGVGDVDGDGHADILVGAPNDGGDDEGSVSLFLGTSAGPDTTAAWTVTGPEAEDGFGASVGGLGDVDADGYDDFAVGAATYDGVAADAGLVLVYAGASTGPGTTASAELAGTQAAEGFGGVVAGAGDVDGDGYADLAVGAAGYDGTWTDEGAAFVYAGEAGGIGTTAAWTATGAEASAAFGTSLASAGDTDADGYADLVVGAPYADEGEVDEGVVSVFRGSGAGLGATADWTRDADGAGAHLGATVAGAGDVDADGFDDVLTAAPDGYPTESAGDGYPLGPVYVTHGSSAGPRSAEPWSWSASGTTAIGIGWMVASAGDTDGDGYADVLVAGDRGELFGGGVAGIDATASVQFGASDVVAGVGDLDGDGFDDVAIADPSPTEGDPTVTVYAGSASGVDTGSPTTIRGSGGGELSRFGGYVASECDFDADGYDDLAVGAVDAGYSGDGGRVLVYPGSPGGVATSPSVTLTMTQPDANFGALDCAGDVNGDGFDDLVVSASNYDAWGAVFLVYGSASGLEATWSWIGELDEASLLGTALGVGDVNGDGYDDLLVAAPDYPTGGGVFLWLGGPAGPGVTPDWGGEGVYPTVDLGSSVAAGDFDGDGYADIAAGSYLSGRVEVWRGGAAGPGAIPDAELVSLSGLPAWGLGSAVASAGDTRGVGRDGLIVGLSSDDTAEHGAGRALVLDCSDGDGDGLCAWFDCDDCDAAVGGAVAEVWYDGVDQDCDGNDDDQDRDGYRVDRDPDDTDPDVVPGATDTGGSADTGDTSDTGGVSPDSGGEDSGSAADSGSDAPDKGGDPAPGSGCGCAASPSPWAGGLAVVLAWLAGRRRTRAAN